MVDMDTIPNAVTANYSVWTADSVITLTNVPWDNNYRDIVKFASQSALNAYIDKQTTTNTKIARVSYARADQPIRLEIPMSAAYGFNYVRVYNPSQDPVHNAAMYYYYFITGIEYLSPGVTLFTVQLDIWQTFGDKVKFGNSYIERGHIGIANENQFNNYGRDYLTLAEGLDTGSDHRIVADYSISLMDVNFCNIMVVSNTDFSVDPGTVTDPTMSASGGASVLGTPSGANVYLFNSRADFNTFIAAYSAYPWVVQGIMSITAIPRMEDLGYGFDTVKLPKAPTVTCHQFKATEYGRGSYQNTIGNWRNNAKILNAIPARFRSLKKFFTYPYMSIELTTFNGTPVVLKPEQWQTDNGEVAIKANVVAPNQRIVVYPRRYNGDPTATERTTLNADGTREYFADGGEYLEMSTSVGNLPSFAIVNNAGILTLANQAHSLAQQYKTTDWSQQKALASNQTSYDQASQGIDNSNYQSSLGRYSNSASAEIANNQAVTRAVVSGGQGMIGGMMGGAAGGGAGAVAGAALGAAGGAAGTALDVQQRNQQTGLANRVSAASQGSTSSTAAYMRDTNKSLADWAANGDYQQSIAAINAKVQDTAMTAPFTSGQAGGETFNFVFGGITLLARWKMIPPAELQAIGNYWLRYGYAVRQFATIPASLMVMSKFTYWKLSETYISQAFIPESFKQAIRGIFEKGVTVWADPSDIGNIDIADNVPLEGFTL